MDEALRALAPAKINLGLFLGPARAEDGKHELVSVMESISLADELLLEPATAGAEVLSADETVCPALPGPPAENLAARALALFRERTGWDAPPLRLSVHKRIPIAAGLGGGSADAAATLRLARAGSGLGSDALMLELAAELGADVPAQLAPGRWLAQGAGERLTALPQPRSPLGVLVLPAVGGLSTAVVFTEADRLEVARPLRELAERAHELAAALANGAVLPAAGELLHNDLQRPAVSLCGEIAESLSLARAAGAGNVLVSGSGPTVLGLFAGRGTGAAGGRAQAEHAAAALSDRLPAALAAYSVGPEFGAPRPLERA
jgi:4-diphosphocytidyl-2-C-methyl-D-erythritol kinase